MKRIYFVSPCQYTVSGFSALMEAIPGHSIRVFALNDMRQLLHYLNAEPGVRQLPSVIVVDVTNHERSFLALSLWFLWNLSVLYSEGRIPARIPCLVLGRKEALGKAKYPFVSICPSQRVRKLQDAFIKALTAPGPYIRKMYEFRHLSSKERFVINACLKGMSVRSIAEVLNTTYRSVYFCRQSAIKKIGLRNLNEFTLLMGRSFL